MSTTEALPTGHLRLEDCSQQLLELIHQAAADISDAASKASTKPISKLTPTESYKIVSTYYYNSVLPKVSTISIWECLALVSLRSPTELLRPKSSTLHARNVYYRPDVMVITDGLMSVGSQRSAVIICLSKEGEVNMEAKGPSGSLADIPCKTGLIVYLAGGSILHNSGEGQFTCIFLGFEKK